MKTPIQKLKSSKLFYGKWPYKIECTIDGASMIARKGTAAIHFVNHIYGNSKVIDRSAMSKFVSAVSPFLHRKDLQIRTEGSHFNIFCKDLNLVESIEGALQPWIVKISGPTSEEELNFLLNNGPKKILCDKLPKDNFQYRVYFKTNCPRDKKLSFFEWCKKTSDKIIISPTSEQWLLDSRKWVQDPFAYVKDDKTLSMIGLQLTGSVKRVEQFVERKQALVA